MEDAIMTIDRHEQSPNLEQLPPLVLAYIGDAVFELYVRLRLSARYQTVHQLHEHAVRYVAAASQSEFLAVLQPHLTEKEAQIMRRGRNAKGKAPRHVDLAAYRRSTGFEALLGYLYLSGETQRLQELLALIEPVE
ncbi:MAG TPA: ribonuclease III domain-containing protein [Limnochordia bacterium]|nr:ribonuclease III domain-containing protein [Limnochordia bacterium]